MKLPTYSVLVAVSLMLASMGAQAQNSNADNTASLADWDYSAIYDTGGLRAYYLLVQDVFGPEGEQIGSVQNAIIDSDGQIAAIIAEVGGFEDTSIDTYVAVPWDKVNLTPDGIQIPVTEDNLSDYTLFADNSFLTMESLKQARPVDNTLATGVDTWKLSALLDDYVVLKHGSGYGYVDDVIFSRDGHVRAILIGSTVPAVHYGAYAFPYEGYAYGWQPYNNVYTLPYTLDAIKTLQPFQYEKFDGYWY